VPVNVRVRFFDGLADPARLALPEALRDGGMTAGEAAQGGEPEREQRQQASGMPTRLTAR
jgi:hypothetical protein